MRRQSAKYREEELKLWQSTPVFLTPEGLAKLKAKLEHLQKILPGLIAETARTAAYGDRSDNAEYKDAKGRMRRTQAQIFTIEDQLKKIKIIDSGPDAGGKIRMGSTVTVETESGEKRIFRIVGPSETNPSAGYISHVSPLGAALVGRKEGDTVSIKTGTGEKKYGILEVG